MGLSCFFFGIFVTGLLEPEADAEVEQESDDVIELEEAVGAVIELEEEVGAVIEIEQRVDADIENDLEVATADIIVLD